MINCETKTITGAMKPEMQSMQDSINTANDLMAANINIILSIMEIVVITTEALQLVLQNIEVTKKYKQ